MSKRKCTILLVIILIVIISVCKLARSKEEDSRSISKHHQNSVHSLTHHQNHFNCAKNAKRLETCVEKIRQRLDLGILKNLKVIRKTCKTINSKLDCMNRWPQHCINKVTSEKRLNSKITGGLKFYQFLCKDDLLQFKVSLRRNENCLTETSYRWGECTEAFETVLRIANESESSRSICCVRLRYLRCMKIVAQRFCPKEVPFFEKLAQILIRTVESNNYYCEEVTEKTCRRPNIIRSSSSSSYLQGFYHNKIILLFINFLLFKFLR